MHEGASTGTDPARAERARWCCPIVELRQYTLKPGRREELIALFEERFIEGQEETGMRVIGQFRAPARPDRFIWLRGFSNMEARRQALEDFYYGPIWQAHRTAANDTMLDSDDVLLLTPARPTSGFRLDPAARPSGGGQETSGGVILMTMYSFVAPVDTRFIASFDAEIASMLRAAGATILAQFVSEYSENTFPRLPVREGEHVFVWFASFADADAYAAYRTSLELNHAWVTALLPRLRRSLSTHEEEMELAPTRRSLVRH
jgi:hypothetical protein